MNQSQQINLDELIVRPMTSEEQPRWINLMDAHHYLGFRQLVGKYLCYVAVLNEQWVALLSWSWAALKSGHRDRWIGWSEALKKKRLRYVVNNSRFLILPGVCIKNLASKVLAVNLKRLSVDWENVYGHPMILAETFVEHARFKGTSYRAQGWIPLGETSGYGKRKNAYVFHGLKKTIWVKPMHPQALSILTSPFIHPVLCSSQNKGVRMDINQLPVAGKGGLIDYLEKIPDPRKARGIRHSLVALLALCVCAALCGIVTFEGMAEWGQSLTAEALKALGFKRGKPPSEPTIRRLLQGIDTDLVDHYLTRWIIKKLAEGSIPSIALDGKTLRGSYDGEGKPLQLLSAIVHKQGVVIAQKKVSEKTNEIPMVKPLLKNLDLEGTVVTADALHTQNKTASFLVEKKKADYVMTVKDNQPTLKDHIQSLNPEDFSPCGLPGNQ